MIATFRMRFPIESQGSPTDLVREARERAHVALGLLKHPEPRAKGKAWVNSEKNFVEVEIPVYVPPGSNEIQYVEEMS